MGIMGKRVQPESGEAQFSPEKGMPPLLAFTSPMFSAFG
jgi:hypothetical protein